MFTFAEDYWLVQAVRQWHKKLIDVLKKIGFKRGDCRPLSDDVAKCFWDKLDVSLC